MNRLKQWIWPDFRSHGQLKRASISAAIVACLSATLTMIAASLGVLPPFVIIDSLIFGLGAYGFLKFNRTLTVLTLVCYLLELSFVLIKFGSVNYAIALVAILFYVNGVRASFASRKLSKTENIPSAA